MNNTKMIFLLVLVLILVALNVIPFARGRQIECRGGMQTYKTRMDLMGLPFGYMEVHRNGDACYSIINGKVQMNGDAQQFDHYTFDSAMLWLDLIINGAVLLAVFYVLDLRKAKQ